MQVVLCGTSYEAGAALFAAARDHSCVRAAVLLYPFWDLYADVSCPGGVPHKRFTRRWDAVCQALDKNRVGVLAPILSLFFKCATSALYGLTLRGIRAIRIC